MEISEFMALSNADRLAFAPTIAKYNVSGTRAFETVITIINHWGIDALNPHIKLGFILNLKSECSSTESSLLTISYPAE